MSYDDEQRSRIVVNTPVTQREVLRTETTRVPVREGISTGAVAAIVVGAVALVTILFLFLMKSNQETLNNNTPVTATQPQQQQPIVIQQPQQAGQQPIYMQQPGTTQPVIIQQPSGESMAVANGTDDASIQSNIDRKISEDTTLASLGLSALVTDGRVSLTGTVNSDTMKSRVERVINSVKGVRGVDNKIVVMSTSH